MSDRFRSAWMKIDRARKYVDDLDAEIRAYWKTGPVSIAGDGVVVNDGGGTGASTFTVKSVKPLPDDITLLVGDAAHNIRSALDHFAFAAVAHPTRHTCFPVWSRDDPGKAAPTPTEWRDTANRQLRGASLQLMRAVQDMSPWETGMDQRLWLIHELDRIDKHRLLISVAAAQKATVFEMHPVLNPVPGFRPPTMPLAVATREWTPLEPGTVLWRVPEGSPPLPDPTQFMYDIALGEPEDLKGQPVVSQLRILSSTAEATLRRLAPLA